ncbi:hypothetical protein ACFL2K_00205 [Candidatus Margulisiibacteriota bacterium]
MSWIRSAKWPSLITFQIPVFCQDLRSSNNSYLGFAKGIKMSFGLLLLISSFNSCSESFIISSKA